MKAFASAEWKRAQRALDSARILIERDPDSAVSRAYYAAFHALSALFAVRGKTFTKHSAIRAALHRDLVKTGELGEQRAKEFDFLIEVRETGDYGGLSTVTTKDAQVAVEKAERFVEAVKRLCPEL